MARRGCYHAIHQYLPSRHDLLLDCCVILCIASIVELVYLDVPVELSQDNKHMSHKKGTPDNCSTMYWESRLVSLFVSELTIAAQERYGGCPTLL